MTISEADGGGRHMCPGWHKAAIEGGRDNNIALAYSGSSATHRHNNIALVYVAAVYKTGNKMPTTPILCTTQN